MKTVRFSNISVHYATDLTELPLWQKHLIVACYYHQVDVHLTRWLYFLSNLKHNWRLLWWFVYNQYLVVWLDKMTLGIFDFYQEVLPESDWDDLFLVVTKTFESFETAKMLTNDYKVLWFRNFTKLIGPADELRDLKFHQFQTADFYFLLYLKKREEKYLNKLIAAIYRYDNAKDTIENDKTLNLKAKIIAKIPTTTRLIILRFYQDSREHIVQKHPELFKGKSGEFTIESIIKQHELWEELPATIADKPNEIEIQKQVLLWDMFAYLNSNAKKMAKI
jgi:hypothetical protein